LEDKQRKRALDLETFVLRAAELDPFNALDITEEAIALLESENAKKWSVRYIADMYLNRYLIGISLGKKKLARISITKAHQWSILLTGNESPDSLKLLNYLKTTGSSI
jgi:hypothetical protein